MLGYWVMFAAISNQGQSRFSRGSCVLSQLGNPSWEGCYLGLRQEQIVQKSHGSVKHYAMLIYTSVVSDSVRPQRRQPTRLPRPWHSPGKNTGVGCHFLLQCMKVKSEREVAQSCPTLSDPMDCSLLGCSVHGIFQPRVVEWGAIAFSRAV